MNGYPTYIPKKGDLVTATGQNGTFEVTEVSDVGHTVELSLTTAQFTLKAIPWGVLIPVASPKKKTREDVNQAAARIVRETTERL